MPNPSRRLKINLAGVVAEAQLYVAEAPLTVEALWNTLPIRDRTIHVRWSGDAWRTNEDYPLRPPGSPIENIAERLGPGDIIYFPARESGSNKIGLAYGPAQWLNPFREPVDVALLGHVDVNLEALVAASERILIEGPVDVEFSRA